MKLRLLHIRVTEMKVFKGGSSSIQNLALPTSSWLGSLLNIEMSDKNNLYVLFLFLFGPITTSPVNLWVLDCNAEFCMYV